MLKSEIGVVGQRRGFLRARRKRTDVPTVALVGYTNAGKTTLFNLLTGAKAVASDALFVTLDPLVRRMKLPDRRQIMLSDTVGFIDRLPHQLVAAFRATLEEVAEAELLVHVIDAAAADRERRTEAVRSVVNEVGAGAVPSIDVFNKIDLLAADELDGLRRRYPDAVFMSATRADGREPVVRAIAHRLEMDAERMRFALDEREERDRRVLADLYRHAKVVRHETRDHKTAVEAEVPRRLMARFRSARAL